MFLSLKYHLIIHYNIYEYFTKRAKRKYTVSQQTISNTSLSYMQLNNRSLAQNSVFKVALLLINVS